MTGLRFGNAPVPYTVAWSGEETFEVARCPYAHRPAICQAVAPGIGRPVFGKPHNNRQRKVIALGLCDLCGKPLRDRTKVSLSHARTRMNGAVGPCVMQVEPLLHRECALMSMRFCPSLRRDIAAGTLMIRQVTRWRVQFAVMGPEYIETYVPGYVAQPHERIVGHAKVELQRWTDRDERARRLLIRSFMGFGSDGHNAAVRTGFRANSNRSNTTPAHDWANYPAVIPAFAARLRSVVIECRPALQVMQTHDAEDALHYLDPPYLPAVRSQKSRRGKLRYHAYKHEMTLADHRRLLAGAKKLKGMVLISGYHSEIYDKALKGWARSEIAALADGARERTEVLWINPAAAAALDREQLERMPLLGLMERVA